MESRLRELNPRFSTRPLRRRRRISTSMKTAIMNTNSPALTSRRSATWWRRLPCQSARLLFVGAPFNSAKATHNLPGVDVRARSSWHNSRLILVRRPLAAGLGSRWIITSRPRSDQTLFPKRPCRRTRPNEQRTTLTRCPGSCHNLHLARATPMRSFRPSGRYCRKFYRSRYPQDPSRR